MCELSEHGPPRSLGYLRLSLLVHSQASPNSGKPASLKGFRARGRLPLPDAPKRAMLTLRSIGRLRGRLGPEAQSCASFLAARTIGCRQLVAMQVTRLGKRSFRLLLVRTTWQLQLGTPWWQAALSWKDVADSELFIAVHVPSPLYWYCSEKQEEEGFGTCAGSSGSRCFPGRQCAPSALPATDSRPNTHQCMDSHGLRLHGRCLPFGHG